MAKYEAALHFARQRKEVVFLLGEQEFPQRATLGVLQRVEEAFGPATALLGKLAQQDLRVAEVERLLRLVLRDHKDLPKGEALVAAIEPVGLLETMAALAAFLTYGISADMPAAETEGTEAGNA
jgi:hypothetical protein